ncbi:MAG: RpiB/LacA/LacB family sugar-phosphate isomerase [Candidatus Paceibacterota bacterium]|jgi:ribose 5-phosphate isomerase B
MPTTPQIILASDHAGFALKESVKSFLESKGYSILDVGAHELIPEDDFPIYMTAAAMKVAEDLKGNTKAIIFGGSGQGEAMVANRFPGVRAVVWYGDTSRPSFDVIKLSREHNDANVLSVGARFVTEEQTKNAVELWLNTPFSEEEKYKRRNDQIDAIE